MQFDGLTVGLNGSTPIRSKNGSTKVTGLERPPIDDPTGLTSRFDPIFKALY